MKIGYARVSTVTQTITPQQDALLAAGCHRLFSDVASGRQMDRPGLTTALSHLRSGDHLLVWKLDRLGRSITGLIELVSQLDRDGISFVSLTEGIETGSASGRFTFHLLAALAQMERDLLAERTQAGLLAARNRGRIGGRPRQMTDRKIEAGRTLLASGLPPKEVAQTFGVSLATLYRWLPARRLHDHQP